MKNTLVNYMKVTKTFKNIGMGFGLQYNKIRSSQYKNKRNEALIDECIVNTAPVYLASAVPHTFTNRLSKREDLTM